MKQVLEDNERVCCIPLQMLLTVSLLGGQAPNDSTIFRSRVED